MTPRELEILHTICRFGGQCSMRKVSKETGLSSDYAFLISKALLNQKLIKKNANIFILTVRGRSLIERSRGDVARKQKTPTLIEVSRSFGSAVEPPSFEPEIHFINKELVLAQSHLTEHNLSKGLITEMADARSIQKSLKRLTFVNRKRSNLNNAHIYE